MDGEDLIHRSEPRAQARGPKPFTLLGDIPPVNRLLATFGTLALFASANAAWTGFAVNESTVGNTCVVDL